MVRIVGFNPNAQAESAMYRFSTEVSTAHNDMSLVEIGNAREDLFKSATFEMTTKSDLYRILLAFTRLKIRQYRMGQFCVFM